jgi:hypothetical protein
MLGLAQFISVFISSWGAFPASDFLVGMVVYSLIMIIQVFFVNFFGKSIVIYRSLLLLLSILNSFYFVFVLTSWSRWQYLVYCCLVSVLFLIAISRRGLREAVFLSIFIIATPVLQNSAFQKSEFEKSSGINGFVESPNKYKEYHKNIYIIGIDGMVSRLALQKIYDSSGSVAYNWLQENGFKLYDVRSAGDQTLTTYGTLLTGKKDLHPRAVRPYFNGSWDSEFYKALRSAGYKIQFFNESDYFGTDVGLIENFSPKHSTFSICNFVDKRWAFYFCEWIGGIGVKLDGNTSLFEKIEFYKKNAEIHADQKWVSLNHIWFPGHTIGSYDGANSKDFENYRNYYLTAQNQLKDAFIELVSFIKKRDPDPVIIFFGDHGAYALRSNKNFTFKNFQENEMAELHELDARSALLAIYPNDFCEKKINMSDTSSLFLKFAECLEGY